MVRPPPPQSLARLLLADVGRYASGSSFVYVKIYLHTVRYTEHIEESTTMRRFGVLSRVLFAFILTAAVSCASPFAPPPDSFDYVLNGESFKLVKVDGEPVRGLKDITTGVYSLRLAGMRAGCGVEVASEGTPR